jgi:ribokinase
LLIVVGSINLDLITSVSRLPGPGETVSGAAFRTEPGGKGANQAVAAARAGTPVKMIGSVGQDAFAEAAIAGLHESHVDLSCVQRVDGRTGIAQILVDQHGEDNIAVVAGANTRTSPHLLDGLAIDEKDVALLQHEIPLETVARALDLARTKGATSILNTAPFEPDAATLLEKADIVVANETEFDLYANALDLSGIDREDRMDAFAARTGKTVIVTLGGEGVRVAGPSGRLHVPAMRITPVDTVGAGDTFCGYLGGGLHAGLPLEAAVRQASVAASLTCLKPGAQSAMPHLSDVEGCRSELRV